MEKNKTILHKSFVPLTLTGAMLFAPVNTNLAPLDDGTAHAQNKAHTATLSPDDKVSHLPVQNAPGLQKSFSIPVKDMNHVRPEVAKTAAAGVSMKGIVVLVTGQSSKLLDIAIRAASDAKKEGAQVLGIIDGGGTVDEVRVYFAGIVHSVDALVSYQDIKEAIILIDRDRSDFVLPPPSLAVK